MIEVMEWTREPLMVMGRSAAYCWGSTPSADIARKCLKANHGRVLEYAHVTLGISYYSARVMRELYTHSVGVSKLQESTRYVDSNGFTYYTPKSVCSKAPAKELYDNIMERIGLAYRELRDAGVTKEDAANILPLGMHTKVVVCLNVRAILHLFEIRTCSRAYHEFRDFMDELRVVLRELDDQWRELIDNYAKTKCDILGYCNEESSCGLYLTKKETSNAEQS